jgi:hypothetical protein
MRTMPKSQTPNRWVTQSIDGFQSLERDLAAHEFYLLKEHVAVGAMNPASVPLVVVWSFCITLACA